MNKTILIGIIMLVLLAPITMAKENQGFGEEISFYAKILEKNPNETGQTFREFVKERIFVEANS